MTSQISNEAAEEIVRLAMPAVLGVGAAVVSGVVFEATTSWSDDFNAQSGLGHDIAKQQAIVEKLQAANAVLDGNAAIEQEIGVRQDRISELQAQSDQFGNESLNFVEGYGISIALGCAVAVNGLKRALRKSTIFRKQA